MAEEKEVNDTGAEEKKEEETPLPTIDPETGEVKEPEPKPEGGENWEKRYKDLQSHSDKTLAERDKELNGLKGLVAPFQKNIKETEGGGLIFDFPKTSSAEGKEKGEKPEEELKEPEDDLWITDPKEAHQQQRAYDREQDRKEREEERKEKKTRDASSADEEKFEEEQNASWDATQKLYPDMKNEDSELYKVAKAILDKDPALAASSNFNLTVARLAAAELGIAPVKEEPSPKKEKDITYIIGGSSGSGNKAGKKLSEAEFAALSSEEQSEYMKKGYMEG